MQLLRADGVLVWVDPITDGRDRSALDPLLRKIASAGIPVSAHPDIILKLGVKEVLFHTRSLGWVDDIDRYPDFEDFKARMPLNLEHDFFKLSRFGDSGAAGNRIQDAGWKMEASIDGRTIFSGFA